MDLGRLKPYVIGAAMLTASAVGTAWQASTQFNDVESRLNQAGQTIVDDVSYHGSGDDGRGLVERTRPGGGTYLEHDYRCFGDRLSDALAVFREENDAYTSDGLHLSAPHTNASGPTLWTSDVTEAYDGGDLQTESLDQRLWEINVDAMRVNGFEPVSEGERIRENSRDRHVYQVTEDVFDADTDSTIRDVIQEANSGDLVDWYKTPQTDQLRHENGSLKRGEPSKWDSPTYLVLDEKPWTKRSKTYEVTETEPRVNCGGTYSIPGGTSHDLNKRTGW